MARPRRISDEEILHEVRRTVLEQGPHVSMDVVAERLGVTAPALFRRFGSRSDLLTAALKPEERPPFIDNLDRGPDDRPVETQLVELFTLIGTFLAGALPCITAMRESGIEVDLGKAFHEPPPLRAVRALSGWLARAKAKGLVVLVDPDGAATAMLGAVQAPIFFRHLAKRTDPWDPVRNARDMARLFLLGVAPKAAPAPTRTASRKTKEP